MDKALIVASCGLMVALIIGAATGSSVTPAPTHQIMFEQKCSDVVVPQAPQNACGVSVPKAKEKLSEVFLRKIKRKARVMFA